MAKSGTIILYQAEANSSRIKVRIPYLMKVEREKFKTWQTAFYHPNQKLWSISNTSENWEKLQKEFENKFVIKKMEKAKSLPKKNLGEVALNELTIIEQKLTLKGFSSSTIKAYLSEMGTFFSFFESRNFHEISKAEIEGFVYHLISKYSISETKQNMCINAIKAYYEHILGQPREYYDIQRPKKSQNLPNILSKNEVARLLQTPKNIKHKAILFLIYSGGLRISEAINLRIKDIHSTDGYIFIKAAKGKKDRKTILSPILLKLLREYYKAHKPSYWLFEGQEGGQYSAKSIQNILRKAVTEANVNPWATVHTLRHSFATHLLQEGTNLRYIQSLLGHGSSKTTEIYTHVLAINNKNIKSPLDFLGDLGIFEADEPKVGS